MWLSFKSIEELAGLELLELVVEQEDGPDSDLEVGVSVLVQTPLIAVSLSVSVFSWSHRLAASQLPLARLARAREIKVNMSEKK